MNKPLPSPRANGTRPLQPRAALIAIQCAPQAFTPAQFKEREISVLLNERMQDTIISSVLTNMRKGKLHGKIDLSDYFCKGVFKTSIDRKLKQDFQDLLRAIEYLLEKAGWHATTDLKFGKGVVVNYSLEAETR